MQIGEKALVGGYNVTCLGKGMHGLVRFTDLGENASARWANPGASLARRRTALSAAFGAYLKQKGVPVAFEKIETDTSVLCRKCEGKIAMEVRLSAEMPMPQVAYDGEQALPEATVTRACSIAEQARDCLNGLLTKHGYHLGSMTLRFGFAGEIVIASMMNFDTLEVRFSEGSRSRLMTNDERLITILANETFARKAA